jgi:Holliday junction resolvase
MDKPEALTIPRLSVWVPGRPAPKGSHKLGQHGQLRDASAYLAAWSGSWTDTGRNRRRLAGAVERAVYTKYAEIGVQPERLPIFRGPVAIQITFLLDPTRVIDGPPDIDKLERATWDALTIARVWEDDARVVSSAASKSHPTNGQTGAIIVVWAVQ